MEKVQINNQVIAMRKLVKQAKVHVINKLVKEVKLLKSRNGDEAKVSKCKRKAERLLLEINLVKKSGTMEHRAVTRLISFGPLQKETEQFYLKFPHLVNALPAVFQQWEVKKHLAFQGEKNEKAAEVLRRKGRCFEKSHSSIDLGHHEPVLNEKFNTGTEENLSEADILSVESNIRERHQKGGKKQSKPPVVDKLQSGRKTPQKSALTVELYGGGRDFFSRHTKIIKAKSTIGTKPHHMNRLKSLGISSSNYYANKSKHSTKYSHKFRKLSHVEKSAMSGRMNMKPFVSGLSSKNVRKQEISHKIDSGANSKLKKRIKTDPSYGVSRSNGKVTRDFIRPKYAVSVNQKSVTASGEKASASLHPSWTAKRKMNMEAKSFIPFQGKKVKFND